MTNLSQLLLALRKQVDAERESQIVLLNNILAAPYAPEFNPVDHARGVIKDLAALYSELVVIGDIEMQVQRDAPKTTSEGEPQP